MDKKYAFDTIEECKKQIVDKCTILDINHITNYTLLECFTRMVKTIIFLAIATAPISIWMHSNLNSAIIVLVILLFAFYVGKLIMSWVKYNYNQSYIKAKTALFNYILSNCREYNETNYKDWERKQIIEKMSSLVDLKVEWININ